MMSAPINDSMCDMLGSFNHILGQDHREATKIATGAFWCEVCLPKRDAAVLEQEGQPSGRAAGARSYNSASGESVGLLAVMADEMNRDLPASQKSEFKALVAFHN